MVTFMSKLASRTPVPSLIGQRVLSAYIFSNELDAHGVVLRLDDGSEISIEFGCETHVAVEVLFSKADDDDAVVLQVLKMNSLGLG